MKWKEIPGFEGQYSVSDTGEIFSHRSGKTLKEKIDRYGYPCVVLTKHGKPYYRTVHRLVALTFIPNPYNKETVNHINEIKTDNRVQNLQWMTVGENVNYGSRNRKMAMTKSRKPVYRVTDNGPEYYAGVKEASRKTGIAHSQIARFCRDQANSEWRYLNE